MEIKVNREIRNYNEAIFLGLSMRQLIFSALAIGVAIGVYFLLRDVMPLETRSWVCISAPLLLERWGLYPTTA